MKDNKNTSSPLIVLSEYEIELIYKKELSKNKDNSGGGVELEYHKETFISGIECLIEYLNSEK